MALNAALPGLHGIRLDAKTQICDWKDLQTERAQLGDKLRGGQAASPPFTFLALSGSAQQQRAAAEIWGQAICPLNPALPSLPIRSPGGKIRVGYFSADFNDHPVMHLAAGMLEKHDRAQFELTAFSFGPESQDLMKPRLMAAFDRFIDVRGHSDQEVALLARKLKIDIAVDLTGFTHNCRPGILALRAAPLQVSYLGYPGTMGVEYMDYLIADRTLIPEASQRHYAEKIIYLPHSYQVNDSTRCIADTEISRQDLQLPPSGFVFCCFNNNFKINPETFDVWMRILKRVDGSVLWLLCENPSAIGNLRREAERRGVNHERLVFAGRVRMAEHLARHRVADLVLDTLPYNAHTTASDALWAGVPVLTCIGEAFASRVAASLLKAMDVPELVTSTWTEYEDLAIELAHDSQRLRQLRQRLAKGRISAPLFNTSLSTRHIEAAYRMIFERYQAQLRPEHIDVPSGG
jgi:predicted O-linked N-acetylglucosamine transferase (SPINDLY family)